MKSSPGFEPFAADDAIVELGDARLADVDAGAAELGRRAGIIGEQRADLAAQLLVDVVAVGALQALDRLRVLEQADVVLEARELGLERRKPCGFGVGFLRAAGAEPAARRRAQRRSRRRRSRSDDIALPPASCARSAVARRADVFQSAVEARRAVLGGLCACRPGAVARSRRATRIPLASASAHHACKRLRSDSVLPVVCAHSAFSRCMNV